MKRLFFVLALLMLTVSTRGRASGPTMVGDLNNFDTVNDTGQTTYGFEIEIDDIRSTDITYTYDWNHYGAPTIREDNTDPAHPKVFVRYASTRDGGGAWGANGSYTNQVVPSLTPPTGHDCTDPSVNLGCEHFGVGYSGTPSAIVYTWLVDNGSADLAPLGTPVGVSTPSWTYTPPVGGNQAQVAAVMPAPPAAVPAGKQYGEPSWVKVIKTTTHQAKAVALADLISADADNDGVSDWQNGEPAEVETEWYLLQTNTKGDAARGELQGAAEAVNPDEHVTRRYEFYRYDAGADSLDGENGEAMCSEVQSTTDPNDPLFLHGVGTAVTVTDPNGDSYTVDCEARVVVGTFVGAQMAGFAAAAPLGLIDHLQDADTTLAYTPRLVVVGGTGPYQISASGLPDGLTLGDYTDPDSGDVRSGVLFGTPTVGGDFTVTVDVIDADGTEATRAFALHVVGDPAGAQLAVTSFDPLEGPENTSVTITGSGFTADAAVWFNGVQAATVSFISATELAAEVPAGATTGTIEVVVGAASATTTDSFTVIPPPTIASVTPASGPVGTTVTVTGTGFVAPVSVSFAGTVATTTLVSATSVTAVVPAGAATGAIVLSAAGGAATSATNFTVIPPPTLTSFTPASGPVGTTVTLNGSGFVAPVSVRFNGTLATSTVISATQVQATVPAGATTGTIAVTAAGGSATSTSSYTVTVVTPAPTVAVFSPTSGAAATAVAITGTNFTGASAVSFNGKATTFVVLSATSIVAVVPAGASTGRVAVTTPGGTATSAASFTVKKGTAAPAISSFTPSSGRVGTVVTLTGANLGAAQSARIGTLAAPVRVVSVNAVAVTIPAGAKTARLSVTTAGGTATSKSNFTVTP